MILDTQDARRKTQSEPLKLDLGSGPNPPEGWLGVDVAGADGDRVVHFDLCDGREWPWENESVSALRAWHVIEHIPRGRVRIGLDEAISIRRLPGKPPEKITIPFHRTQDAFYWFFDEAFRVAKPGCRFELAWPHPWHDDADKDPTHERRIPIATLHYLSKEGRRLLRAHHLPVACDWRVVEGSVECRATDEALKPLDGLDGSIEFPTRVNVFHEIRAILFKPEA